MNGGETTRRPCRLPGGGKNAAGLDSDRPRADGLRVRRRAVWTIPASAPDLAVKPAYQALRTLFLVRYRTYHPRRRCERCLRLEPRSPDAGLETGTFHVRSSIVASGRRSSHPVSHRCRYGGVSVIGSRAHSNST